MTQTDLISGFDAKDAQEGTFRRHVSRLRGIRRQVKVLYDLHPQTVQCDRELWFKWLQIYHGIDAGKPYKDVIEYIYAKRLNYESVSRSGRYWRSKFPDTYRRDDTVEAQTAYKNVFARDYRGVNP